jgi:hypothetical protein
VRPALNAYPGDPELLLLAATAALLDGLPDQSLRYLHRFTKRYQPIEAKDQLLLAIALAQQGRWSQAAQVVRSIERHARPARTRTPFGLVPPRHALFLATGSRCGCAGRQHKRLIRFAAVLRVRE